jgi:hypothetical protein
VHGKVPSGVVADRIDRDRLRFLAGKRAPDRLVIDLSSDSGVLLEPTDYPTIEHLENRLYVPAECVPLFQNNGWQRSTP